MALLMGLISLSVFAQTDRDEILDVHQRYMQTVEQQDNAATLGFIYPKLFKLYPKGMMLQSMNKASADPSIAIAMHNPKVDNISGSMEHKGIKYATVGYSFLMTMQILVANEKMTEFTHTFLTDNYGEENVAFDSASTTFNIQVQNELYAINDPEFTGWKFLEKKESMQILVEQILPKKVLKKL